MKIIGKYLAILIVILILWDTIIMKPLKIFTVYLHELGHALMAVIFGYGIQGFKVFSNESGYTQVLSKGKFSSFMITNGGYLGSVFFSILILQLKKTKFKKFILGTLAIIFFVVSILYSGFSFTLLYSIIFAGVVILLYMINNEKLNDWIIDIIGVSGLAYAIYDTFVDTILLQFNLGLSWLRGWRGTPPPTDAVRLAQLTGIPAILWGAVWLAIAVFAVYKVLIKPAAGKRR